MQSRAKSKVVWGVAVIMIFLMVAKWCFKLEPSAFQDIFIIALSIFGALNNPTNKEGF